RHRHGADEPRDQWPLRMPGGREGVGGCVGRRRAHADFTKQNVWAFKPLDVLSSLTSSSTVIRHVIELPSPCATMFGAADGAVVCKVSDHGSAAPSARCGLASRPR